MAELCRVYWGTHACCHERGHDGPHECDCCECEDHAANHEHQDENGEWVCVAKPPYYGPQTTFYGEDS